MRWHKLILVALKSIARNKMRSLLTMLGIIIGVASVITMVALGEGSQADIEGEVASLGTNLLMVRPGSVDSGGVSGGAGSRPSLTMDDVVRLEKYATRLRWVSAEVRATGQVIAGSNNWSTTITGVAPNYLSIRNYEMENGSFFTVRDSKTRAKVAVLGKTVADELFPDQNPVGARLRIRNVPFKVIGVMAEKGQSSMGNDQDDIIFAPDNTVLYRLSNGKTIHDISASAISSEAMDAAKEELTTLLRSEHRLAADAEDDFIIRDQTEIVEIATRVTGTLTLLLSSIAGVSLLVGGIGIMNIMLVSVTERTREIGIRLAIGARPLDVLAQFLIEAAILSLLGGLIGILSGLSAAWGVGKLLGVSAVVNPTVILITVLFTGAVGVFFGFYPARKAANLNPIDALRYE
ncbi:putative macrolipide-specific ABC-type efflux carrier (MacA conjunction protein) [Desulforapulum autotrophicum HRM2]|jgi:putative ABC transport system permease protein|uniref:Macrolipide-specific ABC-type efflux carrier (MacA conjunction protein) n=1 Tax=Desulforapulum autotrophicum (strain ATCC 43914 / DSM 3382 / VKM B-1955 / HRM2) TaxID=177437 RepID=C0QIQ7_DESAH|nr:ABC transporter permease [Desulforapulum autotrophicum]ACN13697.1 putative macrolipide-specific ABC-type efflux carrier (MacA conjunction protein) [Desulforapulum autotrophicum HRM2]